MSYDALEQSTMEGQPIELYHFYDDIGNHWRYTSAATLQEFEFHDYEPEPIDRQNITATHNHFKNELKLTLGRNNLFALNYVAGMLENLVSLVVYRLHLGDLTDPIIYWRGVVQRVVFDENELPTIHATPLTNDVVRAGARRRCQIMCDLPLYSAYCSVTRSSYQIAGVITGVSGVTLSSATFGTKANGWLTGGMIIIGDAKRLIQWHVGTDIKIGRGIVDLATGVAFTAYAGCNHTATICNSKFSNKINYGGCQFLPISNPFQNAIVY